MSAPTVAWPRALGASALAGAALGWLVIEHLTSMLGGGQGGAAGIVLLIFVALALGAGAAATAVARTLATKGLAPAIRGAIAFCLVTLVGALAISVLDPCFFPVSSSDPATACAPAATGDLLIAPLVCAAWAAAVTLPAAPTPVRAA